MFIEPMKAAAVQALPSDSDRWILQPKLDGWRVIAGVSDQGTAWIETSTGNRIHSVPYINEALVAMFPANTVLDGEISDEHATRERSWNRTQTVLSRDAVHKPTESDPALTFAIFDVVISEGRDLMAEALGTRLRELARLFVEAAIDADGLIEPLRMLECLPCEQAELDRLLAEGYEGVVLKDVGTRYVQGGRSGEWLKLKPDQEIEGVCTGTYEPTAGSKYDGVAVGGVTFRVEHADGREYNGRAAGMTDELRQDLYTNPARYIGRVIELTHKGVTADGALRHPQLRRFRDPADKAKASVPDPLAAMAAKLAAAGDGAKPTPATRRRAIPKRDLVESDANPGTMRKRVGRNYAAMGDDKLLRVRDELIDGPGHDAFDRCVNRGSGDPKGDLALVEDLIRARNL